MPNGAVIRVRDPEGRSLAITEDVYRANPEAYDLVEGQQIQLDPTAVAGAVLGAEITPETLRAPTLDRRLTPTELAERTQEETEQALFGGIGAQATQAVRGVGSALTLGLSEQVIAGGMTGLEREVEQAKRRVGADAFAAGEIIGDIAGAALSGGAGLAARAARLTAPGITTSLVGAGGGLGRKAIAGAIDGAISTASSAIGRQAIEDEPLAPASIASRVTLGALLGSGGGLALGGLASGARRLSADNLLTAGARGADDLSGLLSRADDGALRSAADDLLAQGKRARGQVRLSSLFSKRGKSPELTRAAASDLMSSVQKRASRPEAIRKTVADIEALAPGAGSRVDGELIARLRMAVDDYEVVSARALDVAPAIATEAADAAAGAPVRAPREAVAAMRALDAADSDLNRLVREFQASIPRPAGVGAAVTETTSGFNRALDALGAVEIAGIPGVSAIPGVGPLLGGLAKIRTLYRAASKVGGTVRGTPAVRTAMSAASDSNRLSRIGQRALSTFGDLDKLPGVSRGMSRAAAIAPSAVARIWRDVRDAPSANIEAALDVTAPDLPDATRAQVVQDLQRKLDVLSDALPQPPPGFEYAASDWQPSRLQAARFGEIRAALDDPFGAVGDVLSGRARFGQEVVDAIKSAYPVVFQDVQAMLVANADRVLRGRPRSLVAEWGRLWEVPLLPENQPSYRLPPAPGSPAADGFVTRPPSAQSATAVGAEVRRPGRLG